MKSAIRIKGLSKLYPLSKNPIHNISSSKPTNSVKALDRINLDIQKNECFGIVGKNGSGKSTLLQIISGTLKETSGEIIKNGKIASILELGTSFNPEFTGKENIFLNCSLHGISRQQIKSIYPSIEAFAEIGDFIDLPVRTYSTGMSMRLAFAIITHIEADILIIDEALTVGDIYFTKKCIRFLINFKRKSTLILVTHDLELLSYLCDRAALISNGSIIKVDTVKKITSLYLKEFRNDYSSKSDVNQEMFQQKNITIKSDTEVSKRMINIFPGEKKIDLFQEKEITIIDIRSNKNSTYTCEEIKLHLIIDSRYSNQDKIIGLNLYNKKGLLIISEIIPIYSIDNYTKPTIEYNITFVIPQLVGGEYSLDIGLALGNLKNHKFIQLIHDYERWHVSNREGDFGLINTPCSCTQIVS